MQYIGRWDNNPRKERKKEEMLLAGYKSVPADGPWTLSRLAGFAFPSIAALTDDGCRHSGERWVTKVGTSIRQKKEKKKLHCKDFDVIKKAGCCFPSASSFLLRNTYTTDDTTPFAICIIQIRLPLLFCYCWSIDFNQSIGWQPTQRWKWVSHYYKDSFFRFFFHLFELFGCV